MNFKQIKFELEKTLLKLEKEIVVGDITLYIQDELVEGASVFTKDESDNLVPMPDGVFEFEGKEYTVVAGVISAIKDVTVGEVEPVDPAAEDMKVTETKLEVVNDNEKILESILSIIKEQKLEIATLKEQVSKFEKIELSINDLNEKFNKIDEKPLDSPIVKDIKESGADKAKKILDLKNKK